MATPSLPGKIGNIISWGNTQGTHLAHTIANAASAFDGLTVVVANNSSQSQRLTEEIRYFFEGTVFNLPDWETLPYDYFSPHQDIISERLSTLAKLPISKHSILVIPALSLQLRLPPVNYILGHSFTVKVGQTLELDQLKLNLISAGYQSVDGVFEHGEFCIRGAILDIFPMGSDQPFRIELFDDEVESIRWFNPETQRSTETTDQIELLPAKEVPLDKSGIRCFKQRWFDFFECDPKESPLYTDVTKQIAPGGIEYYLPLFFDETATLFDYLPQNSQLIFNHDLEKSLQHNWKDVENRYEERRHDIRHPVLPPNQIYLNDNQTFAQFKLYGRIKTCDTAINEQQGHENFSLPVLPSLQVNHKLDNPLVSLENFLMENNEAVVFCVESAGRREALLELLERINITPQIIDSWHDLLEHEFEFAITTAPIEDSFFSNQINAWLISENALFGERIRQSRRQKQEKDQSENVIRNLTELTMGAAVVHIDHGVGRYRGMQTIEVDGDATEFVMLEYADQAKLYVPVSSLHLISRYSGADTDMAPLHKLGTEKWSAQRRKALEKIRDTAAELLEVYAKREAKPGHAFSFPRDDYEIFKSDFPFEETVDQKTAINAVITDMMKPNPMDRLVCGDVGFGKTEVALRAAFLAIQNGKQVAVLVPTTLLAQQHYETFRDRFADWPIKVESLSRFKTGQAKTKSIAALEDGSADIVVGTHKLLQGDVKYKDLGLLIIDEEHRFGVQQKEKVKALRAEVDILTMTATPIPRTLNMAMSGVRDLSIIATPPARRLAVKTFVKIWDEHQIKEAVLREILRGGQVYFLHNEVKTINKAAEDLAKLIPEARIGVAHGQMSERELESVMGDFYHKRFNVLMCTTIIETGIDVPNANTIIIERADKFGLAQLHQLRGRVGRSHHQAYAYLLAPQEKKVTKDAEKRLDAISNAQDLGAGFMLATHDLEIRGAGELLGEEQSGHIHNVGFSLYMELLDRAVEAIKAGKELSLDNPTQTQAEINLRIPALIPDDYLPDVHNRLILYKRIANAKDKHELKDLQVEMIDRFGLLPQQVKYLFQVTELKFKLAKLGIVKLDAGDIQGRMEFGSETSIDPYTMVRMVQTKPASYKLDGSTAFKFIFDMPDAQARFDTINNVLDLLSQPSTS
ncbi:transcription-repair coupling factor [Oceaniserpentilla sp. 4NH20-0058]|uniref:transcription-repair coupling factor n=1 Tax=Oceaniserpentilla sp. 4NH20-0058 TaxID=3127660 RepID=UPI00310C17D7